MSNRNNKITLSALSYSKIGELLLDSSKLTFVAVLVTSNLDEKSLSPMFFIIAIAGAVICLVLGLACVNKAAELKKHEEEYQTMHIGSKKRKYNIQVPKGRIDIEIKD